MSHHKPRVSAGHVIWAYEGHIVAWHQDGLTVAQIQTKLREQNLRVSIASIHAVLAGRAS